MPKWQFTNSQFDNSESIDVKVQGEIQDHRFGVGNLIEEYRGLGDAFLRGNWKSASLDGGRFCEVVYTILDGALSGVFPAAPCKPPNFPLACRDLEKRQPIAIGDHSIRILIPRILLGVYDIRNNRNVGHVGGDVSANHMDATVVHSTASWVLAELIRVFHNVTPAVAQSTVDSLVDRRIPLIWEIDGKRRVLDPKMSAADKALLLLHGNIGRVSSRTLCDWMKYSNHSVFRTKVLGQLQDSMHIEINRNDECIITPVGSKEVESRILLPPAVH